MLAFLTNGCRWLERKMLYVPSRELAATPASAGLPFEEILVTASDGPSLHGWFLPREPGDPVVLLCHGNGGNISHRLQKAALLRKAGAAVALFDYRGYGRSDGRPSEQGTYRDAEAVYAWLIETKKVPVTRLVLHGESLGCGVAVELARTHPTAGLILESGFTSTVDMGKRIFPWLPVSWMVSYKYDNLSKLPAVRCPVLVMHSPHDEMIPFEMGKRLYAAAPGNKAFVELQGDHNQGFLLTGAEYVRALKEFLLNYARD